MNIEKAAESDDTIRFPSLESMRKVHTELLKQFRADGASEKMIARVETFIRQGAATGAILDSFADRSNAQSQLDYWATKLYRPDYEPPDSTLDEFDPQLAPELADALCPYVGLDAFHETNQSNFFGREQLIQELIDKLRGSHFLAVLGSSGSGKSSVVRAGLIPELKKGKFPEGTEWNYLPPMVPGTHPLPNLARLMVAEDGDKSQIQDEVDLLLQNPSHLKEIVTKRFEDSVVLVIDQFEETFTLCNDETERTKFVENLIELCKAPDQGHRIIITMRTDFETNIARIPELQKLFEENLVRVTALNARELREAIEIPAQRVGLKFEEGVVDTLLNDTLGEPAALPLLQFTLLKLWEHRERNRVTWEAYKRLGGGRQALARSADELYENLIPEDQVTMKRILLKLVRPGEGLEVTSNRIQRMVLYQKAEANDRIDRVLETLIKHRLLRRSEGDIAADEQIEIGHEALIRNWPRLVEWLEEDRTGLRQRQRLTAAADEWQRLGKEAQALWRGLLLDEARRYDDLSDLEAAFVEASDAAEEAEIKRAENEKQKQRDLEHAQELAKTEKLRATEQAQAAAELRRGRTFLTLAVGIATTLAIVAISIGINNSALAAKNQSIANSAQVAKVTAQAANTQVVQANATTVSTLRDTQDQLRTARNQQLSAQAELTSRSYPSRSLLLALESIKINSDASEPVTFTAKQALLNGLKSSEGTPLSGNTSDILVLKFSPDGRWLATGAKNGEVLIWDRQSSDFFTKPAHHVQTPTKEIKYLSFSGDNQTLAVAGAGQNIYLINLTADDPAASIVTLNTDLPAIEKLETSSDGKWLATGTASSTNRKVLLWNLENVWQEKITTPLELSIFNGDIQQDISFVKFNLQFSPNSKYLVASDGYHSKLWAFPLLGNPIEQEQAHETFYPSAGGWNYDYGACHLVSQAIAQVLWIGFTSDNNQIIAGTALYIRDTNPKLFIWPVSLFNTYDPCRYPQLLDPRPTSIPINRAWKFDIVIITPDSKWLASSSGSDIFVHNLMTNTSFMLRGHQGSVSNLEFSPDSRWLFSASPLSNGDGTARLWDMTSTDVRGSAKVYTISSDISATDIDPKGEWAAMSSENQLVRLLPINASGKDWKEYYASIMGLEKNGLEFQDLKSDGTWSSYGYSFHDAEGKSYSNRFTIVNGQPHLDEGGWFSSDGQWLIQVSGDITVQNLQEKDFIPVKYHVPFACPAIVGYFKDNSMAYVNCGDGGAVLFDLENRPVKGELLAGIRALAGSPDGKWLAGWYSGTKSDLAVFDSTRENVTNNPILFMPYAKDIQTVRFSMDSNWVAVSKFPDGKSCGVNELGEYGCPSERDIHIWNLLKGEPKAPDYSLTVPEPETMNFSKDGRWIGVLSNGAGKLIDLSQSLVKDIDFQIFVPDATILQISFSPDNRWLAVLDDSGHITMVNLQSPDLKTNKANTLFYKVTYMNFDSASDILTGTTEFDDTLIWDLTSLLEDPSTIPLGSTVGKYTTSDGKWLFSLNHDDLLKAVCPFVGRNLTKNEWNLYGFTEDYRATCPQFEVEP